ncbi:MAG: class A beta-lactamase [Myxococcota bacterium]
MTNQRAFPTRRDLGTGVAALAALAACPHLALAAADERGGRLGLAAIDTGTGRRVGQRADERFALCSTFKLVLAASVLDRASRGALDLRQRIDIAPDDLVPYAPVLEEHVGGQLTVEALCAAAVELSDNAAANLLLGLTDGPEGWTRFARSLGDDVSRLDRREPELNVVVPGDPRDTTTPSAYLGLLERLLVGEALAPRARKRLLRWLVRCETGRERLRAGLPAGWRAGDKTGTGPAGEANDVAILWPPGRAPGSSPRSTCTPTPSRPRGTPSSDAAREVVAALG